jgi:glycosyltransferase involved in cell wall biosynthesis
MAIHLIVVGDGEHESVLKNICSERGIADKVTFIPSKPYNELVRYYNAMDLFVMTSLAEGFPMVVLEALASGTPVVANNIGAIPDVITNGHNGYILDSLAPSSVANAISSALAEGDSMSIHARKSSEPYFAEHIADRIAKVVDSLFAGDLPT